MPPNNPVIIYGIAACDTVRKARRWCDDEGIAHKFHDLRTDGLTGDMLDRWLEQADTETLLNRRSTTWKELSDSQKADTSPPALRALMLDRPTLIKRPVCEIGNLITVGFTDETKAQLQGAVARK